MCRLGEELQVEREKGLAGMSAEQLARMRHINSFLEHNLRENGEMLASLGRLQEEKQEMKAANWGLRDRLADCVCSATEERGKSLYGRFDYYLLLTSSSPSSPSPPNLLSTPVSPGTSGQRASGRPWCGKSATWWCCCAGRARASLCWPWRPPEASRPSPGGGARSTSSWPSAG